MGVGFTGAGRNKIGVLGGTFDPVHLGHIMIAEEAKKALELDEVILIPAGQPMSRPNERLRQPNTAWRCCSWQSKGVPYLKVSTIEIERKGPSYTADTIAEIRKKYGRRGRDLFYPGLGQPGAAAGLA